MISIIITVLPPIMLCRASASKKNTVHMPENCRSTKAREL
jgi:hypothetical protein